MRNDEADVVLMGFRRRPCKTSSDPESTRRDLGRCLCGSVWHMNHGNIHFPAFLHILKDF